MELKVYSVYDVKGDNYNMPYFSANEKLAVRMFSDLCNDDKTTVGQHPEDFQLFYLGTFLTDSGMLLAVNPVKHIANASQFRRPDPQLELFNKVVEHIKIVKEDERIKLLNSQIAERRQEQEKSKPKKSIFGKVWS